MKIRGDREKFMGANLRFALWGTVAPVGADCLTAMEHKSDDLLKVGRVARRSRV